MLLIFPITAIVLCLLFAIGYIFAPDFVVLILIFGIIWMAVQAIVSYRYGDQAVLSVMRAKPADPVKHIYLINTVEGLSLAAGIPAPKVYIIENEEINAFAVGRDPQHAAVGVTTGALESLNRIELEGVVAHEISHIRNYDVRFMTMIAVFVGFAAILSYLLLRGAFFAGGSRRQGERGGGLAAILILAGLILAVVAPIATRLVQAMISRRREFLADASAVELTRYPEGLASALEKIMKKNAGKMEVTEAISHLFFTDPKRSPLDDLFATHPPLSERIRVLRQM
ncbi:MAG: M48 family metallopeptidase [Candidatus Hadarchaeum sp.]